MQNLRAGTITPNSTSRIQPKQTDDFPRGTGFWSVCTNMSWSSTVTTRLAAVRLYITLESPQQRATCRGAEHMCACVCVRGLGDHTGHVGSFLGSQTHPCSAQGSLTTPHILRSEHHAGSGLSGRQAEVWWALKTHSEGKGQSWSVNFTLTFPPALGSPLLRVDDDSSSPPRRLKSSRNIIMLTSCSSV